VTTDPPAPSGGAGVPVLVDHLFRHTSGRLVAILTRALGPHRLDLVEEVVQDALIRALEVWPWQGVPDNPGGWLLQVAKHRALDRLRREATWQRKVEEVLQVDGPATGHTAAPGPDDDDQLSMILMCCHPALPREAGVALTMKTVGGFSVREIARAFLAKDATIAQRLVRAKRLIRERGIVFERPEGDALGERLDSALEVIYLMFNEGYAAFEGDALTRADVIEEAIRLAAILASRPDTDRPEVHALLALMFLHASRLPTRTDADGRLLPLAAQERSRWDRQLVSAGFRHLDRAAEGPRRTTWHLEAGIAACHAAAPTWEATDWPRILSLYDELARLTDSPVVGLNRAVAVAKVRGPEAALDELAGLDRHPALAGYYLLPATLGQLWEERGDPTRAAAEYQRALALARTTPERRFLEAKLRRNGVRNG